MTYSSVGQSFLPQQDRLYLLDGKAPTVPRCRTETKFNTYLGNETFKITCPVEVERLQTLPDNYTEGIPKTRRFEAVGNGWTVDVIAHILKHLKGVEDMGFYCINGTRECDGCMDCKPDPELVHCPMCGAGLDQDCTIYYHRESDKRCHHR